MGQQSKRTRAAAPHLVPPAVPQFVFPPVRQPFPPPLHPDMPVAFPSTHGPGNWIPPRPPQSVAASSAPCWLARPHQSVAGSSAEGPCWAPPAGIGGSASPWYTPENIDDSDPQAWGLDSHPPGGFLGFFKNTPSHAQAMGNGTSSQPINVGDDTNGGDSEMTKKCLPWTKDEDLRLVSAWLNNSNDPIQSNYKKNEQYWKEVAAVYNSTTPKNRERQVKQVKDRGRIKKKVAWFCASWKEANALYASGESDVDLKKRAMQTYEADHKEDGPFMFEHCWEVLKKEPKWDAYLERLEDLKPDKRKFSVDDEVGQNFTLDDARDERPPGGKQAKEQRK